MSSRPLRAGELLWRAGEPAEEAVLVEEGAVVLEARSSQLAPFHQGAFVGEFDALRQGNALVTTARVAEGGRVFHIGREDLARFFGENPGVLVSFLGRRFVE
jgi:CRP-like cAMP-binding protein